MGLEQVVLSLNAQAAELLPRLVMGGGCFVAFLAAAFVARGGTRQLLQRVRLEQAVVRLVSQVAFYTLVVLGLITGLGTMGVNVSALVASLGLGGFALGFALRDAITNALAGVLVLVYRPFGAGQRISVAGFEGTVREINLRYTVLEANGAQQLIPNQILFTHPVKVFAPDPQHEIRT